MNIIGKSVRDLKQYKGKRVFVAAYTTPTHCLFASEQGGELIVEIKHAYPRTYDGYDDIIHHICDDTFAEDSA
tara:strand:- start:852 stop:1070 length:219 start_codon:yes stop_codon:yes gene_type:complete